MRLDGCFVAGVARRLDRLADASHVDIWLEIDPQDRRYERVVIEATMPTGRTTTRRVREKRDSR